MNSDKRKYFVIYMEGGIEQKSDPFAKLENAIKAARYLTKLGCPAHVEDENGNIVQ